MFGALRYSAAVASVKAGIARFIPPDVWNRLISAENLEDIISLLSETDYRDAVVEETGGMENIEKSLRESMAGRYNIPRPFLRGNPGKLWDWLWRAFEMNNLVMVLRGIHSGVDPSRIESSLFHLNRESLMDWDRLVKIQAVSDLIDHLERTFSGRFYGRALENAYSEYERQGSVFVLEVALYLAYYRRLREILDALRGRDRVEGERFAGFIIDSRNLLWACRYRVFFKFEPETILSYALPRSERIDDSVLRRAATGTPVYELAKDVWGDELPSLDQVEDQPESRAAVELELIFRRYLFDLAWQTVSHYVYPYHLGTLLAYAILLETEVDDLVTLMEARTAGWSEDQIREELVGRRGRK